MYVREFMSSDPVCCAPTSSLAEVARLMVDRNCGEIPVIASGDSGKPIGVITDRDITCRAVAAGLNPLELTAAECMSSPVITVTPDTVLEECCHTMEQHQIRRVPVVDDAGCCCGVVSQADIARVAGQGLAGEVVREVSRASSAASRVG
ncbi:MAG TPA: CBS domain-containing protein [Vicinamibacterales bacterium]